MCRKIVQPVWPLFSKPQLFDDHTAGTVAVHAVTITTTRWRTARMGPDHRQEHTETLYRTFAGRFFLLIDPVGGDADIRPLSPRAARLWLFQNPPPRPTLVDLGMLGSVVVDA